MSIVPIPGGVLDEFRNRYQEADKHLDAGAMMLATAGRDARPTIRTMTIRVFDELGFVFLSNNDSRKGADLSVNPQAALCAYWPPLKLQVTIAGTVVALDPTESDSLWAKRSRENQLAAWASQQSHPLESRDTLVTRLEELKRRYKDVQVPRPACWQAYRLIPERIEFWHVGWQRLHERVCHYLENGVWKSVLLQP